MAAPSKMSVPAGTRIFATDTAASPVWRGGVRDQYRAGFSAHGSVNSIKHDRRCHLPMCVMDPPVGLFETLGLKDDPRRLAITPMEEIILIVDPKRPPATRGPVPVGPSIRRVCEVCPKLIEERQDQSGKNYWRALVGLAKKQIMQ